MPSTRITVSSPVNETPRVLQVRGIFDLPAEKTSSLEWNAALPIEHKPWNVGLIVGPSGCGKSTIARRLWPVQVGTLYPWPQDSAVIDGFPERLGIKEICELLSSVGFSSPPAWLRPYQVLSTGQKWRADMARLIAEQPELAVVDEYSSVVDRTVAQIGSHAIQKTIRQRNQKFIAITCHDDVEPWLNPDWIYQPATQTFAWRSLQPRPKIDLNVFRVWREAWPVFKNHHYLNTKLAPGAACFLATWHSRPVAFSAWLHSVTTRNAKREHRTVTLPDYQGAGIGHALSTLIASMYKALRFRATSTTTHPAFVAARCRDKANWIMVRAPAMAKSHARIPGIYHSTTRLTAGFEFIGQPLLAEEADKLLSSYNKEAGKPPLED